MSEVSVPELFGKFLLSVHPFPEDRVRAVARRVAAVDVLLEALSTSWVTETGSWRHETGVRGAGAVDLTVSLLGDVPASSEQVVRSVKAALKRVVPAAGVRVAGGAVVVVEPGVRMSWSVRPAFPTPDGGYWVPDPGPGSGWVRSCPDAYAVFLAATDEMTGGGVRRLSRLLKVWKQHHQVPVSSFYLEAKVVQYMVGQRSFNAIYDLCFVLEQLDESGLAPLLDPTVDGAGIVAVYRTRDEQKAAAAVGEAARAARSGLDRYRAGNDAGAVRALSEIFGSVFGHVL
ncbi:hypothetical protein DZF95_03890 [Clavibacter michiganensis]|nr:hypothetical protein DZF95_03890 [Clavibacter michiganensis]